MENGDMEIKSEILKKALGKVLEGKISELEKQTRDIEKLKEEEETDRITRMEFSSNPEIVEIAERKAEERKRQIEKLQAEIDSKKEALEKDMERAIEEIIEDLKNKQNEKAKKMSEIRERRENGEKKLEEEKNFIDQTNVEKEKKNAELAQIDAEIENASQEKNGEDTEEIKAKKAKREIISGCITGLDLTLSAYDESQKAKMAELKELHRESNELFNEIRKMTGALMELQREVIPNLSNKLGLNISVQVPIQVNPAQAQANPVQAQANPVQTQANPAQTQGDPAQAQANPVQTQANPAQAQTNSAQANPAQANPAQTQGDSAQTQGTYTRIFMQYYSTVKNIEEMLESLQEQKDKYEKMGKKFGKFWKKLENFEKAYTIDKKNMESILSVLKQDEPITEDFAKRIITRLKVDKRIKKTQDLEESIIKYEKKSPDHFMVENISVNTDGKYCVTRADGEEEEIDINNDEDKEKYDLEKSIKNMKKTQKSKKDLLQDPKLASLIDPAIVQILELLDSAMNDDSEYKEDDNKKSKKKENIEANMSGYLAYISKDEKSTSMEVEYDMANQSKAPRYMKQIARSAKKMGPEGMVENWESTRSIIWEKIKAFGKKITDRIPALGSAKKQGQLEEAKHAKEDEINKNIKNMMSIGKEKTDIINSIMYSCDLTEEEAIKYYNQYVNTMPDFYQHFKIDEAQAQQAASSRGTDVDKNKGQRD